MRDYVSLFGAGAEAVLLTSEQNIFYAAGFSTTARRPNQIGYTALLMEPERCTFFCPPAWVEEATCQVGPCVRVVGYGKGRLASAIVGALNGRPCGYEREGLPLDLYLDLAGLGVRFGCDVSPVLRAARLRKDAEELARLRQSARLASRAMEAAKGMLRPGRSEADVVAEIEYFMRRNGSSGTPFTMKVLSGEHALRTINVPGRRVLGEGEIVLLDFGATLDNYASDWTRSFALGRATPDQMHLYDLVWRTERACIAAIRPGTSVARLFEAAKGVLTGDPFAGYFNPYLGHSVGIGSQEPPNLEPGTDFVFDVDMVFAIEPGVYVPGVGGIRIEDMVLVTGDGCEVLTGLENEEFVLR